MAATTNLFALLGDDEDEDVLALASRIAPPAEKAAPPKAQEKPAAKPAVKEAAPVAPSAPRGRGGRGGRGGDRGAFRGRSAPRTNGFTPAAEGDESSAIVDKESRQNDGVRGRGRGRGRAFHHHSDDRRHRRDFDRQSGTGRGNEIKRHGAGVANWGVEGEIPVEVAADETEKLAENGVADDEKTNEEVKEGGETKEGEEAKEGEEEKKEEEEDKEMTLQEYERLYEEKRKALLAKKATVRTVEQDKAFETMQKVTKTSEEELVLLKLGPEKDKAGKKKGEDEDRPKTVNLNEFLKPAEGETFTFRRGGGRGGGRGDRRGGRGGRGGAPQGVRRDHGYNAPQINTEDTSQFPTLG